MDAEKVIQDLNRRFDEPLQEFYNRRIIFWHDEDGEFSDKLEEIVLTNAKLIVLTGRNNFEVKKLLCHDDKYGNYVVYCPFSYENPEDNWLADMEYYSEKFHADLISIWMDEMNIAQTPDVRKWVKHYRKFFNNKERRAKLVALGKPVDDRSLLHYSVMAVICGIKDTSDDAILRAVLKCGLENDDNSIYQNLVSYAADDVFWAMVSKRYGYNGEHNIAHLASHLLLTASTVTLDPDKLAGLESFISIPHQSRCYGFVSDWLHSDDIQSLYEISSCIEDELRLPQRFAKLKIDDIVNTECFPCVNEVILTRLLTNIKDHLIESDQIISVVNKRRTCVWYDLVNCFYDGILQVAYMQAFYKEHSVGFHTVDPREIWKEYTDTYYKMDTYYRLFHLSFQQSLDKSNVLLDDLFKCVADVVEGLYKNWFLGELGETWTKACAGELAEYGRILDISQQTEFYRFRIQSADVRMYVIISDAMRYEVAASLTEQLKRETQGKAELNSMQGIFPTITKFGMAALLPHNELTVEVKGSAQTERVAVLADGGSTDSNYREKVLKSANAESVALQYKNIIGLKRAERQALVKGKEVVYIYHNTIDEASHHSDASVFSACDKAISELKNLISVIANDFGGTNIIITSDHGFLYTYSPLKEDEKVSSVSFGGKDVEYGRRYAIMQKDAAPDHLIPIKILGGNSEFDGYAPREGIRIKMSGGGLNFVHGGISLQEMVVPVVEYHFLRNASAEYKRNKAKYDTKPVTISLLSANRKVSNLVMSLNFYQTEPVGDNREAAVYQVYFTDANGKQISDIQKIVADKTSGNSQDRTFNCRFSLKDQKYNSTDTYYLVIADESGYQLPVREEFCIDIPFADDYGF